MQQSWALNIRHLMKPVKKWHIEEKQVLSALGGEVLFQRQYSTPTATSIDIGQRTTTGMDEEQECGIGSVAEDIAENALWCPQFPISTSSPLFCLVVVGFCVCDSVCVCVCVLLSALSALLEFTVAMPRQIANRAPQLPGAVW